MTIIYSNLEKVFEDNENFFFENLCSVQATEGRWVQAASAHSTEQEIEFLLFSKGRGQKKNCEKAVRLTALRGGGVTPLQPDQNYL